MIMFSTSPSSLLVSLSLILLVSISSALSTSFKFRCHKKDASTLLEVKSCLGNPSTLANWKTSIDCCEWTGIWCDDDAGEYRVTNFMLQYSDATGTISPSIARLEMLNWIRIMGNARLKGSIPPSIGELKHLSFLHISENPLLTGPIPPSLCGLSKLIGIDLHLNQLTGPIPGCLGKNLTSINFSSNRLTGSIPGSFMRQRSTDTPLSINLYNNSLTGKIPPSLGDVPQDFIDLSVNRFTDASVLFGEKKMIRSMHMSHNELAFDLSNVEFPLTLESLKMDHNRLTGKIPQQIMMLVRLGELDVSYNKLCGAIPTGGYVGRFTRAESFAHNKCLCGPPLKPCRS